MHQIARNYEDYECYFTPYYADGFVKKLADNGFLDFTILAGKFRDDCLFYLITNNLQIDYRGVQNDYDLVFTGSDLIIPKNITGRKTILVQEGMTDPENLMYYLVKYLKLPRYLASTSTTGLSDQYDVFCTASEGYRDLFIKKGIDSKKIRVTGIPNYDNCRKYNKNRFPYKNFVLVATSDARETYKYENRKKFIMDALEIANGRQLIFKLHPNEFVERATKEIKSLAPKAIVYSEGNIHEMIANCKILVTKYSTVVYTGIALGKEVHSYFDLRELKKLAPIQNNGASGKAIADIGRTLLEESIVERSFKKHNEIRKSKIKINKISAETI
jgi:hypothetical protein